MSKYVVSFSPSEDKEANGFDSDLISGIKLRVEAEVKEDAVSYAKEFLENLGLDADLKYVRKMEESEHVEG